MQQQTRQITTDLAIIGTGLAGIAASIFALNRNISCTLTGNTGALAYTTGYLDLLGYFESKFIQDPWQKLTELRNTHPNHPLAGIDNNQIRTAFGEFTSFISEIGIGYTAPTDANLQAFTPAGTIKPTLCVPATMEKGVDALQQQVNCTIFGFHGLKGFSSHQICANLQKKWPGLTAKTLSLPGHQSGELYAEVAARSLEVSKNREQLADVLKKEAGESHYIGLPAILGMHRPDAVLADLERLTGLHIFEIPTMPPSVPGIRLRESIEQIFPQKGMTLIPQQKVKSLDFQQAEVVLRLADNHGPIEIEAQAVLLATGRFLSGGLEAHFDHIGEPLLDLPVFQPSSRQEWYQEEYLDSRGHEVHMAGIETDADFRPLGRNGDIYDNRLYAAGIVLAHQDWIRQRCGAGIAIASAFKAVEAIQRQQQGAVAKL